MFVLALSLVAALAGSDAASAAKRAQFCKILTTTASDLDSRTKAAAGSGAAQLELALKNFSDYSRLLRRLAEAAPASIKSDMREAQEAWEEQAGLAAQAVKDPLGAVAGGIFTALLAQSSVEAVDRYATRHCGRSVFGTNVGTADASAPSGTGAPTSRELVYLKCDGTGGWTAHAIDINSRRERLVANVTGASACAIGGNVLSQTMLSLDGRYVFVPEGTCIGECGDRLIDLETSQVVVFDSAKLAELAAQLSTGSGLTQSTPGLTEALFDAASNKVFLVATNGLDAYETSAPELFAGFAALRGPAPLVACFEESQPNSFSSSYCRASGTFLLTDPVGTDSRQAQATTNCDEYINAGVWLDADTRVGLSDGLVQQEINEGCGTSLFPEAGDRAIRTVATIPESRIVYLVSDLPSRGGAEVYSFDVDQPQKEPALFTTVTEPGTYFMSRGASAW